MAIAEMPVQSSHWSVSLLMAALGVASESVAGKVAICLDRVTAVFDRPTEMRKEFKLRHNQIGSARHPAQPVAKQDRISRMRSLATQ